MRKDRVLLKSDLANLLIIPTVNMPIDKRLKMDLERPNRNIYRIELPSTSSTIEDLFTSNGNLSSPMSNEELIVPITIDDKSSPRRGDKKRKTHKTYKVYKKRKSSASKTKSSSRAKYQRL